MKKADVMPHYSALVIFAALLGGCASSSYNPNDVPPPIAGKRFNEASPDPVVPRAGIHVDIAGGGRGSRAGVGIGF